MQDPKAKEKDPEPALAEQEHENIAGQADDLDRGTGLGASGGGLGGSTGLWPEGPAEHDLETAGAEPDFDRALDEDRPDKN